ncbi:MAG: TPM domain-containing protein [Bacteriovoracaceae bacterium]|nr:TPM domain-containing protein [Bacteriovoracaceae bacterium]
MKSLLLSLFILLSATAVFGKDIPALRGPVMDEVGWLGPKYERAIGGALKNYYQLHGIQIQVYITDGLDGDSIEDFSIRAVDKWKLGGEATDKGLLLLVAANDRKMRIEVGQGLEGDLTDLDAGRIVDRMKPFFRNGDYRDGILLALKLMTLNVGPQLDIFAAYKVKRNKKRRGGAGVILTIFILISVFGRTFLPLVLFSGGRFGGYGTRHRGSSGGFGGLSGGSSGWSGGGGGFSGGGASGNW